MRREELYDKALEKNGITMQMVVCFEEFAELQKELTKAFRGQKHLANIAEEIADCEIMIEQMKRFFGCENAVERWKRDKLERLEQRLKEGHYERV